MIGGGILKDLGPLGEFISRNCSSGLSDSSVYVFIRVLIVFLNFSSESSALVFTFMDASIYGVKINVLFIMFEKAVGQSFSDNATVLEELRTLQPVSEFFPMVPWCASSSE